MSDDVKAAIERLREDIKNRHGVVAQDIALVLDHVASLEQRCLAAEARAERLEVQLAGCAVAAMGHTSAAAPGDYGWSASYGDVLSLRARADRYAAALRPFATYADSLPDHGGGVRMTDTGIALASDTCRGKFIVTFAHLRAARAALTEGSGES